MDYFSPISIAIFLIDVALAVHVVRSGRSVLWILALSVSSFMGGFLGIPGVVIVWLAYLAFAVVPDFLNSSGTRRFTRFGGEGRRSRPRLSREKTPG